MNTLLAKDRSVFRKWLTDNYDKEKEIYLIFPTKASYEESVSYNDAVEEALCFGWIDTTAGTLDEKHRLRRFTVRKSDHYSRANIERLLWLDSQNMILPKIREKVKDIIYQPYVFPSDIISKLKENKTAWENFQKFSPSYQRIRVSYIDEARKRPEEFLKRLSNFLKKTEENKLIIGYGGIDKYYSINKVLGEKNSL